MTSYYEGQRVTMTVTFTDGDGAAFDPSGVEFRVRRPSGVVDTYNNGDAGVTNPAVGTWKLSYVIPADGRYVVTVESTQSGFEAVTQARFIAIQRGA